MKTLGIVGGIGPESTRLEVTGTVLSALRIYGAIGRRVRDLGTAAWDERVTIGKARKLAFVIPSLAEALAAGRR